MFFVLWDEPFHRPTQDIDFAAQGTAGPDDIGPALQHVCRVAASDGVVFGADHMTVSRIRGATEDGGIRIRFPATVDVARVIVQVDVGFGDSIQPPPADAEFPPLLGNATSRVLAYPKEAVVSEKLSAAIAHGEQTSRYKDFFDLYFMARRFRFEGVRLMQAFAATFEGRRSPAEDIPLPLTTGFYNDTARGARWRAYLTKRGRLRASTDFATVGELIGLFLTPPWRALSSGDPFAASWLPGGPWQPGLHRAREAMSEVAAPMCGSAAASAGSGSRSRSASASATSSPSASGRRTTPHSSTFSLPPLHAPRETMLPEKFHAMASLGDRNSRLKDVWDAACLARRFAFVGDTLRHRRDVPPLRDVAHQRSAEGAARRLLRRPRGPRPLATLARNAPADRDRLRRARPPRRSRRRASPLPGAGLRQPDRREPVDAGVGRRRALAAGGSGSVWRRGR